jgi:hypothetical protein
MRTPHTSKRSSNTSGTLSSWIIVLAALTWLAWPCDSFARCTSNLVPVPTNQLLNVTYRPQQASWPKLPDGCSTTLINRLRYDG